jgi:hypothetical protein
MVSPLRRLLERKGSNLNALRLGKAAVKHPSQLHDLIGWGGDSEAHRAVQSPGAGPWRCSMSERGETLTMITVVAVYATFCVAALLWLAP